MTSCVGFSSEAGPSWLVSHLKRSAYGFGCGAEGDWARVSALVVDIVGAVCRVGVNFNVVSPCIMPFAPIHIRVSYGFDRRSLRSSFDHR
jgi:hypothetical protein